MINIIKMDLYRMFKTRSMYVIWIVMIFITVFSSSFLAPVKENINQSVENADDFAEESISEEEIDNTNLGMTVDLSTQKGENITVYRMFYANMSAKAIGLFLVIFAVIFSTADINSGYIKNIGGQVKNREQLILSKVVSLFVFTILTIGIFILVQAISNGIFLGYVEWGKCNLFFRYLVAQIPLHFALEMICMGLAIALRNNVFSMIISVCLCMNVMTIFYSAIDHLVYKMGIKEFHMLNYTVTGKIALLSDELTTKDSIAAVLIAAIFVVVTVVLSSVIFKKRDI